MRTLLIDNYDSYTYNLFQLIAMVNGVPPTVLANDAASGDDLDLTGFDNIVISPGPGHPSKPQDFGMSAAAVARTDVPLLGVCLGHQGIVVAEGGEVRRAPTARHGHLTTVRHTGDDLFQGIPDGFTAVRYHSLCAAEPLPDVLEATAWAEDDVVMAVRHRERPLWGVQFHPESILTEHGHRLLSNFRTITSTRAAGPRPAIEVRGPRPAVPARQPAAYRMHVRVLEFEVDTEAVFTVLHAAAPRAFWLDSASVEPGRSRFSFLGDGSGPLAEFVTYDTGAGHVTVQGVGAPARQVPGTVFDYLRDELRRRSIDAPDLPFDFAGGYVGYFGYELKADCGSPNKHVSPNPDACWIFSDRMVAVDHEEGRTYVMALDDGSARSVDQNLGWLESACASLRTLPRARRERSAPDLGSGFDAAPWLVRDPEGYQADIEECKQQLLAGESYEICLTNAARVPATGNGYEFYRALRKHNPAPYAAYLRMDRVEVACSSPERFLRVDRRGVVEAKPIKGTAPRVSDPDLDSRLRTELATSAKTRAENLMIVDLLRNDLGKVCEVGSVHVPSLMQVETYQTVHQLVSTVRGRLRGDIDVTECVQACFPGGSMTGAPKRRTMEIIDQLETGARGVYSGAIGFLSCNGTADLNIVIRTAVLSDGWWQVGTGGAIVLDSDSAEEYAEILLKSAATLRAYRAPTSPELVP